MRCEEVQGYLADRLAGSLSDRLSATVQSHVRTHLMSCPECCEEMDDFGEMQSLLRIIPVEPCDSAAMRARFDLWIGERDDKGSPPAETGSGPFKRPLQIVFAIAVLAVAVLAVLQGGKWRSGEKVTPEVPAQSSGTVVPTVQASTISGQVRKASGEWIQGIRVSAIAVPESGTILGSEPVLTAQTNNEGRFRLENVPAGRYYVIAESADVSRYYPDSPDIGGAMIISINAGVALEGINFPALASSRKTTPALAASEVASVSGRVIFENGSDVSDAQSLGEIAMSSVGNPDNASTTIVKLDNKGRFSRSVSTGDYQFRVAVFTDDYVIQSVTSGTTDLMKDNLSLRGDSPVSVEIRVARMPVTGDGRVSGTVLDGATNSTSHAERVMLCCFGSGPAERISTFIRSDGTFAFNGIPSGHYMAELAGENSLLLANPALDVTSAGVAGLKLFTSSILVPIDVTMKLDSGESLPYKPDTSIVFTRAAGSFQVAASPIVGNVFRAFVPAGEAYTVTVSNVISGYAVQSIVDGALTDLLHGGNLTPAPEPVPSPRIVITLTKN